MARQITPATLIHRQVRPRGARPAARRERAVGYDASSTARPIAHTSTSWSSAVAGNAPDPPAQRPAPVRDTSPRLAPDRAPGAFLRSFPDDPDRRSPDGPSHRRRRAVTLWRPGTLSEIAWSPERSPDGLRRRRHRRPLHRRPETKAGGHGPPDRPGRLALGRRRASRSWDQVWWLRWREGPGPATLNPPRGGREGIAWAPDGRSIAFAADPPPTGRSPVPLHRSWAWRGARRPRPCTSPLLRLSGLLAGRPCSPAPAWTSPIRRTTSSRASSSRRRRPAPTAPPRPSPSRRGWTVRSARGTTPTSTAGWPARGRGRSGSPRTRSSRWSARAASSGRGASRSTSRPGVLPAPRGGWSTATSRPGRWESRGASSPWSPRSTTGR